MPEIEYGRKKPLSERMFRHHLREDNGLQTRFARFHNVYGSLGTWQGGREKALVAVCFEVLRVIRNGTEEIGTWVDGNQTGSFTFSDDWLHGNDLIQSSDLIEPINLSSNLVRINGLFKSRRRDR